MTTITRYALILLTTLVTACESQPRESHTAATAPDVDLGAYETFGFSETAFGDVGQPTRILDQNIRTAIRQQMTTRGFEESEAPQLLMQFETASQEKMRTASTRFSIGIGSWGSSGGGGVSMGTPSLENYQEGQLVIRAIDAEKQEEVWVGSLVTDGNPDAAAVARIVETTMETFPARQR